MKPSKAPAHDTPPLRDLEQALGYPFDGRDLLELALTHPSISQEIRDKTNNQRLEFLGDAALQLTITRELFLRFPEVDEGPLSQARARMVNEEALAARAREIDLGAFLRMSAGESASGGRERPSALADAYEAVLGAVFLDGGFESVDRVILRAFEGDFAEVSAPRGIRNSKGELQERIQARGHPAPTYEIVTAHGPDHDREFTCRALHKGVEIGRGTGKSKKQAEGAAASEALRYLDSTEVDGDAV